jgi:hypothetical protein
MGCMYTQNFAATFSLQTAIVFREMVLGMAKIDPTRRRHD